MHRQCVPDTSCLIGLSSLGMLDLLDRYYSEVIVPQAVAEEFGESLPPWMKVERAGNRPLVQALRSTLGPGEAEAIAIAIDLQGIVVVLDDWRARRVATDLGIDKTGTLGLLLKAKADGVLDSMEEALATLETAGFRISDELRTAVLEMAKAGER